MDARDIFLHVHIRKTGGRTFNEILRRNFGAAYAFEYGLVDSHQYTAEQVETMLRIWWKLRCVASHRFSFDLPWDIPDFNLRTITFVRDPARRIVSMYFFYRNWDGTNFVPEMRTMLLPDFVKWAFEGRTDYVDRQIFFLTKRKDEAGFRQVADRVSSGRALLFPNERFNEGLVVLERLFPECFRNLYYESQNISTRDQPVPDGLLDVISQHQKIDLRLHKLAHETLDALIARLFPDRDEFDVRLARFAKR